MAHNKMAAARLEREREKRRRRKRNTEFFFPFSLAQRREWRERESNRTTQRFTLLASSRPRILLTFYSRGIAARERYGGEPRSTFRSIIFPLFLAFCCCFVFNRTVAIFFKTRDLFFFIASSPTQFFKWKNGKRRSGYIKRKKLFRQKSQRAIPSCVIKTVRSRHLSFFSEFVYPSRISLSPAL